MDSQASRTTSLVVPIVALWFLNRKGLLRPLLTLIGLTFGITNLFSYIYPQYINQRRRPQNLRLKYDAKWALVTGASTGLGAAISDRLAEQSCNVVLVALEDEHLARQVDRLRKRYTYLEFRAVGVNMNDSTACLEAVRAATADISVSLVFNNAGYIYLESLYNAKLDRMLANMECMVNCVVKLTDHFYKDMVSKKRRGAIIFTTSQAAFFPAPLSTVYSGCKAFGAAYAAALAIEAKQHNVDVLSVQPGYMTTHFTSSLPNLSLWSKLAIIGQTPQEVTAKIFASVGNINFLDSGAFSWGSRLLTKILDHNALVPLIGWVSARDSDFQNVISGSASSGSSKGTSAPSSSGAVQGAGTSSAGARP